MSALPLLDAAPPAADAGPGALMTPRGALPLVEINVEARADGLVAATTLRQVFVNSHDEPLEAQYVFPLPSRAAVTRFRLEVAGRVVEGQLREKEQARREYQRAIEKGHRAALAEEEGPDTFTMKVGNLPPGERATVSLEMCAPLPYQDGEVTYRFPLVVAPRYGPSKLPQAGGPAREGPALSITVEVGESALGPRGFRSSLHTAEEEAAGTGRRFRVVAGERPDRDFILRWHVASEKVSTSLVVRDGLFLLALVPPRQEAKARPRDLVFLLDRSGSMSGWKMVAARRALARMVETLTEDDRFTIYAFDDAVEVPPGFDGSALVPASEKMRFRAAEWLAGVDAAGGTEMAEPLARAAAELARQPGQGVERVLVLITDGQVSNEEDILAGLAGKLSGVRTFTLGIDRAVNEGFLRRLAELGGGRCELVESEERLDAVMDGIHRAVGTPVLTNLSLSGLEIIDGSVTPARLPDLFAGQPVLIAGRCAGAGPLTVRGMAGAEDLALTAHPEQRARAPVGPIWARGHIRDLEDRMALSRGAHAELKREIVSVSLAHGVLSPYTSFVAVDLAEAVNPGGETRQVVQPPLAPSGWGKADDASANLMDNLLDEGFAPAADFLGDKFLVRRPPMISGAKPMPASPSAPPPPCAPDDHQDFDDDDACLDDCEDSGIDLSCEEELELPPALGASPSLRSLGAAPGGGVEHLERADFGGALWSWLLSWLGLGTAGEDRPGLRKRAQDIIALVEAGQLEQALEPMKALVRGLMRLGDRSTEAELVGLALRSLNEELTSPGKRDKAREACLKALRDWLAMP